MVGAMNNKPRVSDERLLRLQESNRALDGEVREKEIREMVDDLLDARSEIATESTRTEFAIKKAGKLHAERDAARVEVKRWRDIAVRLGGALRYENRIVLEPEGYELSPESKFALTQLVALDQ